MCTMSTRFRPVPTIRSFPARARSSRRGTRCGSPTPQIKCGRSATVRKLAEFAASTSRSAIALASGYGLGQLVVRGSEIAAIVDDAGCAGENQARDTVSPTAFEQCTRTEHVRLEKILVAAPD